MIKSKDEALELCKKYDVKLKDYKTVVVTERGNIYVDTLNVDKLDSSNLFYVKGGDNHVEASAEKEVFKGKNKLKDGNESKNNI